MAFCGKCGTKVEQGDTFCSSCGNKLVAEQSSQPVAAQTMRGYTPNYASQSGSSQPLQMAAQQATYFTFALAALSLLALLMGDLTGLIISAALIATVHFGAVKPLQSGKKGSAASILLICAAVAGVIGLLVLLKGAVLIGAADIAAGALGFLAWQSLNKA